MPRSTTRSWPVYGLQEGLFPLHTEKWRRKAAFLMTLASMCLFAGIVLLLGLLFYPWTVVPDSRLTSAREYEELLQTQRDEMFFRDLLSLTAIGIVSIGGLCLSIAYGIFYVHELRRLKREQRRREGIAELRNGETITLTTHSLTYGGIMESQP